MKPNTRLSMGLIFGLLVVLVALLLRSGWITGSSVNKTPTITPRPAFMHTNATDIGQIQVVDLKSGDRFIARRGPDTKWQIIQAKESADAPHGVDDTKIENAVTVLASIEANRTLNQIEALAQYGLEKPSYQIIVTDKVGDTTISIGSKNPDASSYYTQKSGSSDLYLISTFNLDSLIEFLTTPPYLTATPGTPGTGEALATPTVETSTPSGSPTAEPTLFINSTIVFTPRATSTPTATITPTPSDTPTPGPTGTATKAK